MCESLNLDPPVMNYNDPQRNGNTVHFKSGHVLQLDKDGFGVISLKGEEISGKFNKHFQLLELRSFQKSDGTKFKVEPFGNSTSKYPNRINGNATIVWTSNGKKV